MFSGILFKLIQTLAYYVRTFLILMLVFFLPAGLFLSTFAADVEDVGKIILISVMIIAAGWTFFSVSELAIFNDINREELKGEDHHKTICYWISIFLIALIFSALTWALIFSVLQNRISLSVWMLLTLAGALNALFFTGLRWKNRIQSVS